MPGPCSEPRKGDKRPDTGSSNPKARARLAARQKRAEAAVSNPSLAKDGLKQHMPGSENRRKGS